MLDSINATGYQIDKKEVESGIIHSLDTIQERVKVLMSKDTEYSLDILHNLRDDLHDVVVSLKRGK